LTWIVTVSLHKLKDNRFHEVVVSDHRSRFVAQGFDIQYEAENVGITNSYCEEVRRFVFSPTTDIRAKTDNNDAAVVADIENPLPPSSPTPDNMNAAKDGERNLERTNKEQEESTDTNSGSTTTMFDDNPSVVDQMMAD